MHGFLLLDKPVGLSSNHALQRVRRLYGGVKGGHTGTLDPLASGMLPIALGEATKLVAYLLESDKAYAAVVRLGARTATGDAEGEIVETSAVPPLDGQTLESAVARFRGSIEQVPPMYAALKHGGVPLYRWARRGVEVARAPRQVCIHRIEARLADAATLALTVECSKGTYLRTLAEDLGRALGCAAHLGALRRLWVAPFRDRAMIELDRLESLTEAERAAQVLPPRAAVPDWPALVLEARAAAHFAQGRAIEVGAGDGRVWVEDGEGTPLGLGRVRAGRLEVLRGLRC